MSKNEKMVYVFADKKAEGNAQMRNELGGKGANLHEMTALGLRVPPGFTITTDVCLHYANKKQYPDGFEREFDEALGRIEQSLGRKFGGDGNGVPLLLSCRSGARQSMPGMMDTVLNIGLNDDVVQQLAKAADERFALDCYRRLVQMHGNVVAGVKEDDEGEDPWDRELARLRKKEGVKRDDELSVEALRECVQSFKAIYKRYSADNIEFPTDPREQLLRAVGAVFGSWNNPRAVVYRQRYNIPDSWGTACNVQTMVYGNMDNTSATGVAFTRDPATGERVFFGEWLVNAQGEDVVSGVRTPQPINENSRRSDDAETLESRFPEAYKELDEAQKKLENHFCDMQDIELTIERGTLYILQTRNGKRTSRAAFRMASEMVHEGLIDKDTAVSRIDADGVAQFLADVFDDDAIAKAKKDGREMARGLPAGPGAASGVAAFSNESAQAFAQRGKSVVLVRRDTSPEDIAGMSVAVGMLTVRGGMTSHCALVARQMNKTAIVGAESLEVDYAKKQVTTSKGVTLKEGEYISLDGVNGIVYAGHIATKPSDVLEHAHENTKEGDDVPKDVQIFRDIMQWSDNLRRLEIRVNADTAEQVKQGVMLGAQGVGLTRTEHMFFQPHKIAVVREMILARDERMRAKSLNALLDLQRSDFEALFRAVDGKPITVRLLDPPLHEFLPQKKSRQTEEIAKHLGVDVAVIERRLDALHESQSMSGHRGCRLGITHPDLTRTQARALIEAALKVGGVQLEIMVPLVAFESELVDQHELVRDEAKRVFDEQKKTLDFKVGTMIETPRAALIAGQLAKHSDFFSVGSNDLTQSTLLMSRDDTGTFMPQYKTKHIVVEDPFRQLDQDGVGALIKMARDSGKAAKAELHVGLCGEHGGDPRSIEFLNSIGLDYVSCSPSRVPVARIAAAQAALKAKKAGSSK